MRPSPHLPPHLPPREILHGLGFSPGAVAAADGGFSGCAWKVSTSTGPLNLRYASTELTSVRLAAMDAARRAGLPVPSVVARTTTPVGDGVLLSWMPGTTILAALAAKPDRADDLGAAMGSVQRLLHEVAAPVAVAQAGVPDAAGTFESDHGLHDLPVGNALLHLDIHPANLLVDDGRVTGVLDWDNVHRGHPLLDLARTRSILTEDPALADLAPVLAKALPAFTAGWESGYGPPASEIPDMCREWARRVMRQDLTNTGRLGANG